jgi:hypothetical protein
MSIKMSTTNTMTAPPKTAVVISDFTISRPDINMAKKKIDNRNDIDQIIARHVIIV